MAGLAEILEENERLRKLLALKDEAISQKDEAISQKDALLQKALREAAYWRNLTEEQSAKASLPATERFYGQEVLPFSSVPDAPVVPLDEILALEKPEQQRRRRGTTPKRRDLSLLDLPKRTVSLNVADTTVCFGCGAPLKVFGQHTSHRIEWVPGHFEVLEIQRETCSCPDCPSEGAFCAPSPFALDRAMCGNSLLTRVLVDKFGHHIPLNRQAERMAEEGFEIGTNTLSNWVASGASVLRPVAQVIFSSLMNGTWIQGDDTGLPVQDGQRGSLRKGRLWVFTDQQQAMYAFTPTKKGKHPKRLLEKFGSGVLLVDGGSEFNAAAEGRTRAGCWAHARRKFHQAMQGHPAEAKIALTQIRDLFLVERRVAEEPADARLATRQAISKGLVDGLFEWLRGISPNLVPKSRLAQAVGYALNQESELRVFLDAPDVPMHNNLSELLLRRPVVGRKNWLFAGSEGGAQAACTLFTIIASCRLQGVSPRAYLEDVLPKIGSYPAPRVWELTPSEWARSHR